MASSALEERVCETCGKTFTRYKAHMKKPTHGRYCSRACWFRRNGGKEQRTCETCGKVFSLRPCEAAEDTGRFCSRKCYWEWMKANTTGENNANYQGRTTVVCKQCAKEMSVAPSRTHGPKRTVFCSHKCKGEWQAANIIGEVHPNWLGGSEGYPSDWARARRDAQTDKCNLCGKTAIENKRNLPVHHIDYDKTNSAQTNLVTLCDSCHARTNFKRAFWLYLFARRDRIPPLDWQHKAVICG